MIVIVYRHCPCDPHGNGAPAWHSALALASRRHQVALRFLRTTGRREYLDRLRGRVSAY